MTEVTGEFEEGDVVALVDPEGRRVRPRPDQLHARPISTRIKGLETEQIAAALGHCPYDEVIHRDNMTLTSQQATRGSGAGAVPAGDDAWIAHDVADDREASAAARARTRRRFSPGRSAILLEPCIA